MERLIWRVDGGTGRTGEGLREWSPELPPASGPAIELWGLKEDRGPIRYRLKWIPRGGDPQWIDLSPAAIWLPAPSGGRRWLECEKPEDLQLGPQLRAPLQPYLFGKAPAVFPKAMHRRLEKGVETILLVRCPRRIAEMRNDGSEYHPVLAALAAWRARLVDGGRIEISPLGFPSDPGILEWIRGTIAEWQESATEGYRRASGEENAAIVMGLEFLSLVRLSELGISI